MESKILYRLVDEFRRSYDGFQWPEVGGTVTAPDWNPDPTIDCGHGLHAGDIGDSLYWPRGKGYLQEIVFIGPYVRSFDGRKYRGQTAKVVGEHKTLGEEARKIFLQTPRWAYNFALWIEKGPSDDVQEVVRRDPKWGEKYHYNIGEEKKEVEKSET